ncbi:hypothetical protein Tco_0483976 [Tanacetum coccineum]
MNPQEILQAVAHDEKWVPSAERVKISSTNIILETTVPQKEETFQVIIDVIKNSMCFKAFTISADVPKIFMQQFWYTIKKVPDTDSYEFLLTNKKCTVNAEVFRTILDICKRVEGVDFADVPDDDSALTFLIDLGYKGEDYQEYGLAIPDVMLTDAINHLKSYQMFIKYSTHQIPPKKSRGKGSKGRKVVDDSQETVDVSKESEPEPAKKKTSAKRRVKKQVTLSADDNVISDDHDAALELAKSISQTEAEEAEAARKVHATHARIVTESVSESAKKKSGGRSPKSIVIQDTLSAPKSKPTTSKAKLKGASSLTPAEQDAANIMQALKGSKKTSRRLPGDEQDNEHSDDVNDDVEKDEKIGDADDEGDDHVSDAQDVDDEDVETESDEDDIYAQDVDDEDVETESDEDDIYKYKICMRKDEDVEMKDVEVEEIDKGEEKVTDAAKEEAEKTSEAKDDTKKTELPPSSSSLSIQSPSVQKIPVSVIPETINLPPIPKSNALTTVELRVVKLEKDVSELKTIDHSSEALTVLKSYVPTVVDSYLDTKVRDVFQKELQKHTAYLIHKYSMQHLPELTKKQTPTAEQEYEKSPSDILKIKKEQVEKQKKP